MHHYSNTADRYQVVIMKLSEYTVMAMAMG